MRTNVKLKFLLSSYRIEVGETARVIIGREIYSKQSFVRLNSVQFWRHAMISSGSLPGLLM